MAVLTAEQANQLAKIRAQNKAVLASTQWTWVKMANDLGTGASPNYALGTDFRFTLANASAYVDTIRVWLIDTVITNSSTTVAGATNRGGLYALLGQLVVRLGNHVYRVPSAAIPLLIQTFSSQGKLANYRGDQSGYAYQSSLFAAPSSVAASGNSTYTGYFDIPLAMLEKVYDPDGIAPTLSNTGLQVEFTTPAALQGNDALISPFQTVGTLALSGGTPGTVSVWAHVARQVSVADTGALPPFVVGPAFVFEDVPQQFFQAETFYPFQGQQAQLILVKSIVVIDSPGELTGEFSDPKNIVKYDLMYDANTPVYESGQAQNPYFNTTAGLMNWMVDQGEAIGDQPPGMYVHDFSRGTDPEYPNSVVYANLEKFSRMGVRITYAVAPQAGAQIHFLNVYLNPNFYEAQRG